MEIEVGKKYKRRDGEITTIVDCRVNLNFPNNPYYCEHGYSYTKIGSFAESLDYKYHLDLIEEVKEEQPMKIEVGKYYKTKDGEKVHIIWDEKFEKCPNNAYYLDTGGNRYYKYEVDRYLIEEWKEPKKGIAYVNVYKEGEFPYGYAYINRSLADDGARELNRIACVRVEWTEGQFDD